MRSYNFKKQTRIVMACCTIHNFIRLHATRDELFDQFQDSDAEDATVEKKFHSALQRYHSARLM
ncbi:hypothetical protein LINPERPRIM_LOCUS17162 [Linum perenne]